MSESVVKCLVGGKYINITGGGKLTVSLTRFCKNAIKIPLSSADVEMSFHHFSAGLRL